MAALWSALTAPALVIFGTGDFISDEADHRLIVGRPPQRNHRRVDLRPCAL